ncbi:hypothetical protein OEZ85_014485 [Tetradesmus obliquus]|uniref:CST complex subunit CTC1 n=1 Tax=Tetradesmus obliquus TaxID=3088 RepID=A0ABY8UC65_TETOB|nr:hypothetical protein OEZ85_014485 [Tetradesmus obliquus]
MFCGRQAYALHPEHAGRVLSQVNCVDTCYCIEGRIRRDQHQPRALLLHLPFAARLFAGGGTVLCVEAVIGRDQSWTLLMDDIMACAREPLLRLELPERLGLLHRVLQQESGLAGPGATCRVEVKRHAPAPEAPALMGDFASALPYPCRGVLFRCATPAHSPSILWECPNKQAPVAVDRTAGCWPQRHTQQSGRRRLPKRAFNGSLVTARTSDQGDGGACVTRALWLQASEQPDVYHLYETKHAAKPLGIAGVHTIGLSKQLKGLFHGKPAAHRLMLECSYSSQLNKWVPAVPV